MQLTDLKTIIEILQGIVTTLGILVAGIWSIWTFVILREPASKLKLDVNPRYSFISNKRFFIVLEVQVSNIGKTKMYNEGCSLSLEPLSMDSIDSYLPNRVDAPFKLGRLNRGRPYNVLDRGDYLEPSEILIEEVVLQVESETPLRVALSWKETGKCGVIRIIIPQSIERQEVEGKAQRSNRKVTNGHNHTR